MNLSIITDQIKEDKQYEHKFKNRGKISKHPKHYLAGNSSSPSLMRPTSYIKSNRIFDIGPNKQISKNIIIDSFYKPTSKSVQRKSILPNALSLNKPNTNKQQFSICKQKVADKPRMISLFNICDRLYLGNICAVNDLHNLQTKKINNIINLSDTLLSHTITNNVGYKFTCHNITFKDNHTFTYRYFMLIINEVINIINNSVGNILIVCNKGVNRSPSIAIAYAIIEKKMSYNDACEYIDNQKYKLDPQWNNLTNYHFKNMLKALKS